MFIARETLSLVRSYVGAQPLLLASEGFRCRVSLLTERGLWAGARGYKYLAPLERKRIQLLLCKLNSPIIEFK
jgi:hypothetical protein